MKKVWCVLEFKWVSDQRDIMNFVINCFDWRKANDWSKWWTSWWMTNSNLWNGQVAVRMTTLLFKWFDFLRLDLIYYGIVGFMPWNLFLLWDHDWLNFCLFVNLGTFAFLKQRPEHNLAYIHSKPVVYVNNGGGRDTYISNSSGGLRADYRPAHAQRTFYSNLR